MDSNDAEVAHIVNASSPGAPSEQPGAEPLTQQELTALWDSEPLTQTLCEANGISASQFLNKAHSYSRLDMFLSNFPRMTAVGAFSGLTSLYLIHQSIPEIRGLSRCRHLVECVIMECRIEEITGLENCTALERLDLSGNELKKISGLSNLVQLKKLWIAENNLKTITGLSKLINLTDLNLAGNRIERIGAGLSHNHNLITLNLAANRLGGFKDLLNLTHLPNLTKLILQDAQYGSNLVCALCNYQTYVLCHVQHIVSLDNSVVTTAAHQTAEATFIKKKMYYNMRIKTLKRSSSAAIKQAMELRTSKIAQVSLNVNVLTRHCKDIERELREQDEGVGPLVDGCIPIDQSASSLGVDSEGYLMVLRKKLGKLQNALQVKEQEMEDVEARFEHARTAITEVTHQQISRLVLELETGGNIRLEDGTPEDPWYSSCVDLMQSRFFEADFAHCNVGGIWIKRVTRVHNRCLRNLFEEKVDQYCTDTGRDTEGSKKALEYLFAADRPEAPGELQRISEFGFRDTEELEEMGLGDSVQLANTLTFVEPLAKAKVIGDRDSAGEIVLPPGVTSMDAAEHGSHTRTVLVTKVLLGNSSQEVVKKPPRDYKKLLSHDPNPSPSPNPNPRSESPAVGESSQVSTPPDTQPVPLVDEKLVRKHHGHEFNSIHRCKPGDPKQKQWFVFDSGTILPEYLVEYENASVEDWAKFGGAGPDNSQLMLDVGLKPEMLAVMGVLASPFENFVKECAAIVLAEDQPDPVMAVVNMSPVTAVRPKLQVIVPDALTRYYSGTLANLTYLNLHSNNIRQLEHLSVCVNLRTLVCCFNEIHKIENLTSLKQLERLELGFNFIKRLDGLQGLANLKILELNNNLIYRMDDLDLISQHNPQLTELNLSNNAVSDVKSSRALVLGRLQTLRILDRKPLTESERGSAMSSNSTVTTELLYQCSHFVRRSQWSHINKADNADTPEKAEGLGAASEDWMKHVEELDMDHRRLRTISSLDQMVKLRRASFCDNELTLLEGLDKCCNLEELFLEENKISKIDGLGNLHNLRKLDLGRNKITRVDGLEGLQMLSELSLEDNEIEDLSPLSKLYSLMELYLCNNRVANLHELLWFKEHPKLIILDMFGNPCFTDQAEYRLHTVFHLKKLKVLDGVPVDMQELHDARDKYAGRITQDWIEEHLGHRDFAQVTELELPSAFIREAVMLFSGKFESLRQLNLDNNLIWDLSTFENMPSLRILKLNNNRVGQGPTKGSKEAAAAEELLQRSGFGVGSLPSLEVLYLEGNHIATIPRLMLSNLTNLQSLYLGNNDIAKLEGLGTMPNLRGLSLNKNKLKQLDEEAFMGLGSLRELSLEENGLKNLTNLEQLGFLHSLHLTGNRIQDFGEIDKLSSIRTLLEVSIQNNPIARKAFYRVSIIKRMPSLEVIDQKPIGWEERERADASSGDYRSSSMYPSIVKDPRARNTSGVAHHHTNNRVPVKVTSVTFECIGGVRPDDQIIITKGGNVEMPLSREQQQALLAAQARAEDAVGQLASSRDPRDEFFLPNVGVQKPDLNPRRRANSEFRTQDGAGLAAALPRPRSTAATDKPLHRQSLAKPSLNANRSRLTINAGLSTKARSSPRVNSRLSRVNSRERGHE